MQEMRVRSLDWEDSLEKGKATHSSILAWKIHGLYNPWGLLYVIFIIRKNSTMFLKKELIDGAFLPSVQDY